MKISKKDCFFLFISLIVGGIGVFQPIHPWLGHALIVIGCLGIIFVLGFNIFQAYRNKRKTKNPNEFEIKVEITTGGRYSKKPETNIIITNLKKHPTTVVRVLIKEKDKHLIELSSQGFDLPQTIKYQDHINLSSPYIAHNIEKIERIFIEDIGGKRWDLDKKTFEQAKKTLRNFIGNGLVYPSMGHELDEDKIK